MTIAICVTVHDGVVLATDSAASMGFSQPNGPFQVSNVYDNANKISNLIKGVPVGAMVWGAGSIGYSSQATLAKDLRLAFSGGHPDPEFAQWKIQPNEYTVQQVAERARQFLTSAAAKASAAYPAIHAPSFGMLVAGFSSGAPLSETWLIDFVNGQAAPCVLTLPPDAAAVQSFAQNESVIRLINGFGTQLPSVLQQFTNNPQLVEGWMQSVVTQLGAAVVHPAMPIQDAIDLAAWLVHNAIMWSRFLPGAPTVGGPVEVAAITKHEGFRWIKRKHYFDAKLNPS